MANRLHIALWRSTSRRIFWNEPQNLLRKACLWKFATAFTSGPWPALSREEKNAINDNVIWEKTSFFFFYKGSLRWFCLGFFVKKKILSNPWYPSRQIIFLVVMFPPPLIGLSLPCVKKLLHANWTFITHNTPFWLQSHGSPDNTSFWILKLFVLYCTYVVELIEAITLELIWSSSFLFSIYSLSRNHPSWTLATVVIFLN